VGQEDSKIGEAANVDFLDEGSDEDTSSEFNPDDNTVTRRTTKSTMNGTTKRITYRTITITGTIISGILLWLVPRSVLLVLATIAFTTAILRTQRPRRILATLAPCITTLWATPIRLSKPQSGPRNFVVLV
jgi:hypothetical protein